jgi:dTDP-4-amino-4,6-dideoxygalactose transaminase
VNLTNFIPFHLPSIGPEEIGEVVATLQSGWLTSGPRTARFEQAFREYVGAPYALGVNSCTAGLHLALTALKLHPGDEVITTPLTFCATVNAIIHAGGTPVLADVGRDGLLDPASVAARITPRTRGIVPVHIAGMACEMNSIWELARKHNLFVVEDAAHSVGTVYEGAQIGSGPSAAVAFSFYATKSLTTGEGGMVTTHDPELIDRMKLLCLHGISKDAWNRYSEEGNWYYEVVDTGFKYNLSDLQSAVGIHQLAKQEEFICSRARLAEVYNEAFAGVDEIELPPVPANGRHSWHLYMLRLNLDRLSIDRSGFIAELRRHQIGASVHFIPIGLHPAYGGWRSCATDNYPQAMELYPRLISLPLYPAMSLEQVRYVARTVIEITKKMRRRKAASA